VHRRYADPSALIRNSTLNAIGQAAPMVVGLVAIPTVIAWLGKERLGVLFLAWMLLGYFGLLDLGIGRATTRFVAQANGEGRRDRIAPVVWAGAWVHLLMGLLAGGLFALSTFPIVSRLLAIPGPLVEESRAALLLLSTAVPFVFLSSHFAGVLEAEGRFGHSNAVRAVFGALLYGLPLVGVLLGFALPGVVALLAGSRVLQGVVTLAVALAAVPELRRRPTARAAQARALLAYGSWITVSSVLAPLLTYADRLLIASLLGMQALADYSVSFELIIKTSVLSQAVTQTVFPAVSGLAGHAPEEASDLQARSLRYLVLAAGSLLLAAAVYAPELLRLWLGGASADESALVLRILALGVLCNAVGAVMVAGLQGAGRPDLIAKAHLCEGPIYLGLAYLGIRAAGIAGAAGVWTLRVLADALLLAYFSRQVRGRATPRLAQDLWRPAAALCGLGAALVAIRAVGTAAHAWQGALACGAYAAFAFCAWRWLLDARDRLAFRSALGVRA
jgi:O-antigen/teichoic acid export membrane protein